MTEDKAELQHHHLRTEIVMPIIRGREMSLMQILYRMASNSPMFGHKAGGGRGRAGERSWQMSALTLALSVYPLSDSRMISTAPSRISGMQ